MTKAERNYSQIEKEALSIIYGVQKFRYYLLGRSFILRTDHRPLFTIFDATKLSTPTRTSCRLARWGLQLSLYKYNIEYCRSSNQGNADALSRLPVGSDQVFDKARQQEVEAEQVVASIESQITQKGPIVFDQLQKYTKKNSILQEVVSYIKEGWPMKLTDARLKTYASCKHQLSVNNGCLLKHGSR